MAHGGNRTHDFPFESEDPAYCARKDVKILTLIKVILVSKKTIKFLYFYQKFEKPMRLSLPVGTQNSWPNRGPRDLQTRNSHPFEMRTRGLGGLGKDCSVNKTQQ